MHRTTIYLIKKEAHPKVIRSELVLTLPSRREGVNSFIADKYKYTFPMIWVCVLVAFPFGEGRDGALFYRPAHASILFIFQTYSQPGELIPDLI